MNIDLKKAKVIYKDTLKDAKKYASEIAAKLNCGFAPLSAMPDSASLFIVIGGDGTILKCARKACKLDIPVFGFNMGRLGFLSQARLSESNDVIKKLQNGDFRIEERLMLTDSNGDVALNDIVLKSTDCMGTSQIELIINNKQVCSYLADGLIVSTPTGSTAYNLSAGGAVIAPEIECVTIVPICAHTLSARPIIISADETIEIKFHSPSEFQIISDGKAVKTQKEKVIIKKYDKKAKLLLLNSENKEFYDVLRDKLNWGVAPRA